jgi:hypothetical protein
MAFAQTLSQHTAGNRKKTSSLLKHPYFVVVSEAEESLTISEIEKIQRCLDCARLGNQRVIKVCHGSRKN